MNLKKENTLKLKKSSDARIRLLKAAMEIFGKSGFDSVTTRQIAAKAKVNLASIPYYFGSKKQLYSECISEILSFANQKIVKVRTAIEEEVKSESLSRERALQLLEKFAMSFFDTITSKDMRPYAPMILHEHISPSPTFDILYKQVFNPQHKLVSNLIAIINNMPKESTECILQAHIIFGQNMVFLLARNLLLKRLGKTDKEKGSLSKQEIELAKKIIKKNIHSIFSINNRF